MESFTDNIMVPLDSRHLQLTLRVDMDMSAVMHC